MKTRAFRFLLPVIFGAALTALLGCGTTRRQAPETGAGNSTEATANPQATTLVMRGQHVFYTNCSRCHPGGERGRGPALNNKPLPDFAIRFQVRHGGGGMPAFPESSLSNNDLQAVIAYLKTLRHHRPANQAAR